MIAATSLGMKELIENIYNTFAKYKLKDEIKSNDPGPVAEVLYKKPLKNLMHADLWDFAYECVTIQGDEEDFKHFLPRILELFSEGDLFDFTGMLTDKFKHANWRKWEKEEQQLIEAYFLILWEIKAKQYYIFDGDAFVESMLLLEDATLLLNKWQIENNEPGLHALIHFMCNYYIEISVYNKWHIYKKLDQGKKYLLQINSWLKTQLPILENALNGNLIKDKIVLENLTFSIELIKAID